MQTFVLIARDWNIFEVSELWVEKNCANQHPKYSKNIGEKRTYNSQVAISESDSN